ncbi:hypothetical protein T190611E02C_20201 [Tenacibaculum sp. 190524A05c]
MCIQFFYTFDPCIQTIRQIKFTFADAAPRDVASHSCSRIK